MIGQAEVLKQGARDTTMFPKAYIYVSKVPKEFKLTRVLPAMVGNVNVQALVAATKVDKRADLKLCNLGAGMEPEQVIMHHDKLQYIDIMVARHGAMGRPFARVNFNPDSTINWGKSGFFELLPPPPPAARC